MLQDDDRTAAGGRCIANRHCSPSDRFVRLLLERLKERLKPRLSSWSVRSGDSPVIGILSAGLAGRRALR
jgi:hypothetical protein